MNFLIEGNKNIPRYTFGYTLLKAIEFQKEFLSIEDRKIKIKKVPELGIFNNSDYKNWCPVGSIKFVHNYFRNYNIPIPKPINIPKSLFVLSGLKPKIIGSNIKLNKISFIKSIEEAKHPLNGVKRETPEIGQWQVTDYSESFISEWRCFIHHNKIVDCKIYSGDWNFFPDIEFIKEAINRYSDSPVSYTLDIGIVEDKENKHRIVECHDFYSCGLYGFNNEFKYPQMLSQWYFEYLKKVK